MLLGCDDAAIDVTFIVPCFNEVDNVEAFYSEFKSVFDESGMTWELVFVDDGSSDGTFDRLERLAGLQEGILAIRFSRNFGKEAAIWAGLNNARGRIVGIIDADLQQPPNDALAMARFLVQHPDYDVVAAYQQSRYERGLMAKLKETFYSLMSKMTGMDMLRNASDFRVFRRNVARAILELPESCRFSKGIFAWIGFETFAYPYSPRDRAAGETKWSVASLLRYAAEGILAFSTSPLRIATILGLVTSASAFFYCLMVMFRTLVAGVDVPGYATTIGVTLFLGGMQLLVIGIMGEYLARTYIQGKNRPIYIEKCRVVSGVPKGDAGRG